MLSDAQRALPFRRLPCDEKCLTKMTNDFAKDKGYFLLLCVKDKSHIWMRVFPITIIFGQIIAFEKFNQTVQ